MRWYEVLLMVLALVPLCLSVLPALSTQFSEEIGVWALVSFVFLLCGGIGMVQEWHGVERHYLITTPKVLYLLGCGALATVLMWIVEAVRNRPKEGKWLER